MKHFEFMVEDSSGKVALEKILPKLISHDTTYNIHFYKGIGRIPSGLSASSDPQKRILLDQLPRILRGLGNAFSNDPPDYRRFAVIICDLDNRDLKEFESELITLVNACTPKPTTLLCLAIEEGEAWLLGDPDAVMEAYPNVNRAELMRYEPDSICGTWEFLADLTIKGGARALKSLGYQEIGKAKHSWAENIAPHIDANRNRSPSFRDFVAKISGI